MKRAPEGCKTPAKDREEYKMTAQDFKFMKRAADKITNMLSYYVNMPENKTGELVVSDPNVQRLMDMVRQLEDILTDLNGMRWE